MKRKTTILGVIALAAAMAFAAEQKPAATNKPPDAANTITDLFPDTVVAKGKGFEIKRSKLDDVVSGAKANMAVQGRSIPPSESPSLERKMLERLIQIQLLLGHVTDADKAAGKEAAEKRFQIIKTNAPSEDSFDRQLKLLGMTQEQLRARLNEEATSDAILRRELKTNITDEQAKKFYEENPSKFEEPEMVRASHVLIGTRDPKTGAELSAEQKAEKKKRAEDVLKRARDGEDFAKLAKEFSDDSGSKNKGGEYTFARAAADPTHAMPPEFEAAAFSLKTNQVSDIVTTQVGYHIIKLSEKIPAKKVEFAKVSEDIKQYLTGLEIQKEMRPYFDKLKKEANVEILDEKLKAIDPFPEELPPPGK